MHQYKILVIITDPGRAQGYRNHSIYELVQDVSSLVLTDRSFSVPTGQNCQ